MDTKSQQQPSYSDIKAIAAALSCSSRIRIMELLRNGEQCACKLIPVLNLSQPNFSSHMKCLIDANLVISRTEGRYCYYRINHDALKQAGQLLIDLSALSDTNKD